MSDYKLGEYKEIKDFDFVEIEKLILNGHILFVVHKSIQDRKIKIIRGYMHTDDESNWYRCYVNDSDSIKNYCCISRMIPYYISTNNTVEPYEMQNGVIPLYKLSESLKSEVTSQKNEYEKSIFVSCEAGDSNNFGGPIECFFCEKFYNI